MAQANGLNPVYSGKVTALAFRNTIAGEVVQKIRVRTNGTTAVNIFGTTNGFQGSITGIKVIGTGTTSANITVKNNVAGAETTIATIAKGTTDGGTVGCAISTSGILFTSSGTATVVSSADGGGNAIVEVEFIMPTAEIA